MTGSRAVTLRWLAMSLVLAVSTTAGASGVSLGGLMNHLNVNVTAPNAQSQFPLVVGFDDDPGVGLDMALGGDDLDPPFSLLNGKAYNAQYGWLIAGRWGSAVQPNERIFIELLDQSDGLSTYQGGFGVDTGGDGISDDLNGAHTLEPIFGTDDSPLWWQWDGRMTHNWYVSEIAGPHFATYRVFVAEALPGGGYGQLSSTFLPAEVTLRWIDSVTIPEPAAAMLLGLGAVGLGLRRPRKHPCPPDTHSA